MAWTPDKMITVERAEAVAKALFPHEEHHGDCRNETGREGEPCSICAANNAAWLSRVAEVRDAMLTAFGYPRPRPQISHQDPADIPSGV